jgi:hypothetical protein
VQEVTGYAGSFPWSVGILLFILLAERSPEDMRKSFHLIAREVTEYILKYEVFCRLPFDVASFTLIRTLQTHN